MAVSRKASSRCAAAGGAARHSGAASRGPAHSSRCAPPHGQNRRPQSWQAGLDLVGPDRPDRAAQAARQQIGQSALAQHHQAGKGQRRRRIPAAGIRCELPKMTQSPHAHPGGSQRKPPHPGRQFGKVEAVHGETGEGVIRPRPSSTPTHRRWRRRRPHRFARSSSASSSGLSETTTAAALPRCHRDGRLQRFRPPNCPSPTCHRWRTPGSR